MKYYETNYDEYLHSYDTYNLHPELDDIKSKLPKKIVDFKNMIIYGPCGIGKYTQMLSIIQNYSPSKLKYNKKIFITFEKQEKKTKCPKNTISTSNEKTKSTYINKKTSNAMVQIKKEKKHEYIYRISDIHYEIDMATLGCNSKLIWHDLFFQIVDIISVSTDKIGIIVCKNFHLIHNELLDIFYSYIRHPLQYINIKIKFIIITENIGFIQDNILNICQIIPIKRPTKEKYLELTKYQNKYFFGIIDNIIPQKICKYSTKPLLNEIDVQHITNIKEIYSFTTIKDLKEIPNDIFNIICDTIIENILHPTKLKITELRNNLYDLLIYNIDVAESIWYIFTTLINQDYLNIRENNTEIINNIFMFLKYYNNNYRSIYHLESIILSILNKIHYHE